MEFLTSNIFVRNGGEFRSTRVFRSDHRIPARAVAESGVREASRALDSSKEGGYQQSVESEVKEFANHAVGSVSWRFEDEERSGEVTTLTHAPMRCRYTRTHDKSDLRLGKPNLIDNRVYLPWYRKRGGGGVQSSPSTSGPRCKSGGPVIGLH